MKKIIVLFLSFCIICSLAGCGKEYSPIPDEKEYSPIPDEKEFSEYRWPTTEIAKLMPVPKSSIGKLEWSADYGFVLYVANTTQDDFNVYADECEKAGFMGNYRRGDTYFYGDDENGYHVSLRFDEGDIMFVRIDKPKGEEITSESEQEIIEEKPEETESPEETSESEQTDISEESETIEEEPEEIEEAPEETAPSVEKTETPVDPFSDLKHETTARMAFENYGDYIYPYGIKYHWFSGSTSKYEGGGIWYFKVNATITNQYNAEKDVIVEGRVDFNEEMVSEFNILPVWD